MHFKRSKNICNKTVYPHVKEVGETVLFGLQISSETTRAASTADSLERAEQASCVSVLCAVNSLLCVCVCMCVYVSVFF